MLKKASAHQCIQTSYPGKVNYDLEAMRKIEEVSIITLISMCDPLQVVASGKIGVAMMNMFIKLLIKFYTILTKLTKHLQARWVMDSTINFEAINFSKLLRSTKKVTKKVGKLIMYVEKESTVATKKSTKLSLDAKGKKVSRDTKQIPNLVFSCEKFSCSVIALSSKAKQNLNQLIYLAASRDYTIDSKALKLALEEKLQQAHSNANEDEDFDQDTDDQDVEIEDENEEID